MIISNNNHNSNVNSNNNNSSNNLTGVDPGVLGVHNPSSGSSAGNLGDWSPKGRDRDLDTLTGSLLRDLIKLGFRVTIFSP